jgi:hypothetical protein
MVEFTVDLAECSKESCGSKRAVLMMMMMMMMTNMTMMMEGNGAGLI